MALEHRGFNGSGVINRKMVVMVMMEQVPRKVVMVMMEQVPRKVVISGKVFPKAAAYPTSSNVMTQIKMEKLAKMRDKHSSTIFFREQNHGENRD